MAGCSAHSLQAAPTRPPGASTRRSEEHRSTTQQGDAPVDGHGAHAPDHPRRRRRAVPGHHLQRLEGGRHTWAPSSSTMSPSLPVILTGVGIQPTTDQGKTVITREYSLDCRGRGYSLDSRRNGHCQSASWARAGRACAAFVTRCYPYSTEAHRPNRRAHHRLPRPCYPPCFPATAWWLRPPLPEPSTSTIHLVTPGRKQDARTPSVALPRAPGTDPAARTCHGQGPPTPFTGAYPRFRDDHTPRIPAPEAPTLVLGPVDANRVL